MRFLHIFTLAAVLRLSRGSSTGGGRGAIQVHSASAADATRGNYRSFSERPMGTAGTLFIRRPGNLYLELDLTKPFNQHELENLGERIGVSLATQSPLDTPLSLMFIGKLIHDQVELGDLAYDEPIIKTYLEKILSGEYRLEDLGIFDDGEPIPAPAEYVREELEKYAPPEANEWFAAIRAGLNRVWPIEEIEELRGMNAADLGAILNVSPEISIDDLRANMKVDVDKREETQFRVRVEWLLNWLGNMDKAGREKFVRFATGLPRLPAEGFSGLKFPFTIRRTHGALKVHACFKTIDLPMFDTEEDLRTVMDSVMTVYEGM